jgi:hypothetical protein
MENSEFEKRFSKIKAMPKTQKVKDAWKHTGSTPLDRFFIGLAELYLEANDNQRSILYTYCGQQEVVLQNLWHFIRRIGTLIHTKDDRKWLEIGIAGALLDGNRGDDFRDLITSLVLLRFITERRGIEIRIIFDTFIQTADGEIKGILENVRNHPESAIHMTVQTSHAPKEWVAESIKVYGKYNMSEDKWV